MQYKENFFLSVPIGVKFKFSVPKEIFKKPMPQEYLRSFPF